MATTTITIQVEPEAVRAFAAASPEDQRKMQLLLSLRLQDLTTPPGKPLQAVMDEIGARAAARGLTPEILESLLRDESRACRHGYECGRPCRTATTRAGARR